MMTVLEEGMLLNSKSLISPEPNAQYWKKECSCVWSNHHKACTLFMQGLDLENQQSQQGFFLM